MDPFSTHIPVLASAIVNTTGPILEVGTGDYSGALIRSLAPNRDKLTLDNDPTYLRVPHDTILISNWDRLPRIILEKSWGCVFVDCAPALARISVIRQLASSISGCLVIHDTEPAADEVYRYSEIYPLFRHVFHFDKFYPMTSCLTNNDALSGIMDHLR